MKLVSLRVRDVAFGTGGGPTTGPRAATGGAANTVTGACRGGVAGGSAACPSAQVARLPQPPTALPPFTPGRAKLRAWSTSGRATPPRQHT